MSIRRMTDNVAVISSLPDTPAPPAYNAAILKSKFDEAANKLKTYINDVLIPDVEATAVTGLTAVRKLLASYTTAGTFTFDTEEHPSEGGIYDVILIGGGGGGSVASSLGAGLSTGGGAGAVTKVFSASLDGSYTVTVGAAGAGSDDSGTSGGTTSVSASDYSFFRIAVGGGASSQTDRIGKSGGIGGGDSVYLDGTYGYGRGGDNEYGRGVRGGALADDVQPAQGYGAGGWAGFAPTAGAVFIYGYEVV